MPMYANIFNPDIPAFACAGPLTDTESLKFRMHAEAGEASAGGEDENGGL